MILPIIPRDFKSPASATSTRHHLQILAVRFAAAWLMLVSSGCETLPEDAFRLPETALETRQLQTRRYNDVSEREILVASSAVLQDLGYAIDEVEKELGVVSASKRANASNSTETAGMILLDAAGCVFTLLLDCDNEAYLSSKDVQDIRLTVVVLPHARETARHDVRITIQRIVWDRGGKVLDQETVMEADVYQAFFDKLTKSIFLETEGV